MRTLLAPGEVASTCFGANDYSNGVLESFQATTQQDWHPQCIETLAGQPRMEA